MGVAYVVREAAVGPATAIYPARLSVEDIADFRYDRAHSLYRIPFGPARGALTIRNLIKMDWKGRKGAEFEVVAAKHGNLLAGLNCAKAISKAYRGVLGVVWMRVRDPETGEMKQTAYPRKGMAQQGWRTEHPEIHAPGKTR